MISLNIEMYLNTTIAMLLLASPDILSLFHTEPSDFLTIVITQVAKYEHNLVHGLAPGLVEESLKSF